MQQKSVRVSKTYTTTRNSTTPLVSSKVVIRAWSSAPTSLRTMTTAIQSCSYGGATLHATDGDAVGGGSVTCGDFLRKFADAVRYQTMSNTAYHVSSDAITGSEISCLDTMFGEDSASDLASSSTTSSTSFLSHSSTSDRKQKSSTGRHRSRRKENRIGGRKGRSVNDTCEVVPVSGARRNERERNRVRQVNAGFDRLRDHVPQGRRNRKLSKVDTLRAAVDYIAQLQLVLGGPCFVSPSSISKSPSTVDDVGRILRDINDNTINCGVSVNGSHNKPHSVVPDESSSSSSTSMTELLFEIVATATTARVNENLFPVAENSPSMDGYGHGGEMGSTSADCSTAFYSDRFPTLEPEETTRRVRHSDSGSLSSPAAGHEST